MHVRRKTVLAAAIIALFVCTAPRARAVPPAPHGASSKLGLDAMLLEVGTTKLALMRVSAATFAQGSPATDDLHEASERPAHEVTITNDFYLAQTPTTRAQFEAFVTDSGYRTDAERGSSGGWGWDGAKLAQGKQYTWRNPGFSQTPDDPVVLVTFDDALAFASWVGTKTGHRARLPTEAEYELAARGGTTSRWYSGDDKTAALGIGWFKENAGQGTKPVAQKKANAFGLYDMSGDVWEWCADAFGPYPSAPATDPLAKTGEAGQPLRRVLRGGSWLKDSSHARSSARYRNTPGSRNADNGFRIALDLVAPSPTSTTQKPLLPTTGTGAQPTPTTPSTSTGSGGAPHSSVAGWSIVGILLAFGGGLVAIVVALVFGLRRLGGSALSSGTDAITTRNGADGFFLIAPSVAAGSRVQYQCLVRGTWRSGVVPISGLETFVYTGTPPDQVRVLQVMASASPAWKAPPPQPSSYADYSSGSSSSSSDDSSFLGSPRAY
jgi:sulfatase modifying factor 1